VCFTFQAKKKNASVVYENFKLDNEVLRILLPVLYIVDVSKSRRRRRMMMIFFEGGICGAVSSDR
jgi:hypothetical protein